MAIDLAQRGFRVFAGMRDPARREQLDLSAARHKVSLDVVKLDVTCEADADAAVLSIVARCGAIYGLINNAGVQVRGYFEDQSEAEIRQVIETNVFGAMNVTRSVLPHMRAAGRGRIVMVTSVGGRMGSPGLTSYCASKFALEGIGECLALEVAPMGIQVVLVEPGIIRTEIWGQNRNVAGGAASIHSPYYRWFAASEKLADWALRTSTTTPEDVASVVHTCLTAGRPRLRYVIGWRARVLLACRRLFPTLFERIYFNQLLKRLGQP
jgi:NAD(P)-dependent dehydrogenase (short-subunit alcohol dehydrogenase family)